MVRVGDELHGPDGNCFRVVVVNDDHILCVVRYKGLRFLVSVPNTELKYFMPLHEAN